jgi:hypothetical protein
VSKTLRSKIFNDCSFDEFSVLPTSLCNLQFHKLSERISSFSQPNIQSNTNTASQFAILNTMKYLVCFDGSAEAKNAVLYAANHAKKDDEIVLFGEKTGFF